MKLEENKGGGDFYFLSCATEQNVPFGHSFIAKTNDGDDNGSDSGDKKTRTASIGYFHLPFTLCKIRLWVTDCAPLGCLY